MKLFYIGLIIILAGCTPKTKESAVVPDSESVGVEVNNTHVLYDGPDREDVLKKLSRAIERYEKTPKTDGGMIRFGSLEEHSQAHYIKIAWEDRVQKTLRINTYPSTNPMWEVSFVVDANDTVTDMVTATEEPAPEP